MKNWNIASLKFVSEMYNGLCHFFGSDAEETTEAELHQKLIEAGTLENMKAEALREANDAVQSQMADFQSQLEGLQTQFAELKADADAKAEKVMELESQLAATIEAANGEIEGLKAENKNLSGTVASLRAGKPIEKDTPPDASKAMTQAKTPNGGRVVTMAELAAAVSKSN